ncbi:MAG: chalcone isomerase family protein [Pseudomonadota bacterium]
MNTKAIVLLLAAVLCAPLPTHAMKVGDIAIPDALPLDGSGHELLLNGAGMRVKFFMDIYVGALYLPARTADPKTILADTGAASVLMKFVYKEVSRDKIVAGWNDGLASNLERTELDALAGRIAQFNALFTTVRRGDSIRIDYNPATGTEVRINEELRGTVAGNDFFRALLRIWLGEHPVSTALKSAMLGRQD